MRLKVFDSFHIIIIILTLIEPLKGKIQTNDGHMRDLTPTEESVSTNLSNEIKNNEVSSDTDNIFSSSNINTTSFHDGSSPPSEVIDSNKDISSGITISSSLNYDDTDITIPKSGNEGSGTSTIPTTENQSNNKPDDTKSELDSSSFIDYTEPSTSYNQKFTIPTTNPTPEIENSNNNNMTEFFPTNTEDTSNPTISPTDSVDTSSPTIFPTDSVDTSSPTIFPTDRVDTSNPTIFPTDRVDTSSPTIFPTDRVDTSNPTIFPTDRVDTSNPTIFPTDRVDTSNPTIFPTDRVDTSNPTIVPTFTEDTKNIPSTLFNSFTFSTILSTPIYLIPNKTNLTTIPDTIQPTTLVDASLVLLGFSDYNKFNLSFSFYIYFSILEGNIYSNYLQFPIQITYNTNLRLLQNQEANCTLRGRANQKVTYLCEVRTQTQNINNIKIIQEFNFISQKPSVSISPLARKYINNIQTVGSQLDINSNLYILRKSLINKGKNKIFNISGIINEPLPKFQKIYLVLTANIENKNENLETEINCNVIDINNNNYTIQCKLNDNKNYTLQNALSIIEDEILLINFDKYDDSRVNFPDEKMSPGSVLAIIIILIFFGYFI